MNSSGETVRVHIPELKAEIEIDCQLHDTFWHLKLCLVDSLLSARTAQNATASVAPLTTSAASETIATAGEHAHAGQKSRRRSASIVGQLLSSRSSSSSGSSRRNSSARNVIASQQLSRCRLPTQPPSLTPRSHSSGGSLSSTDASLCSTAVGSNSCGAAFRLAADDAADSGLQIAASQQTAIDGGIGGGSCDGFRHHQLKRSGSALQYGFNAFNLSPWDDNARHSSDLTENEEAAIEAIALATSNTLDSDNDCKDDEELDYGDFYDETSAVEYATLAIVNPNNRTSTSLLFDNDLSQQAACVNKCYKASDTTTQANKQLSNDGVNLSINKGINNDGDDKDDGDDDDGDDFIEYCGKQTNGINNRLFEQALKSGYLNYGFYSFSLAKYVDDQTLLTEYLSLVSSSSGTSYYLDLEFKLKQRQQTQSAISTYYLEPISSSDTSRSHVGYGSSLNVINWSLDKQRRASVTSVTSSASFSKSTGQRLASLISSRPQSSKSTYNGQGFDNMIGKLSTTGNLMANGSSTHAVGSAQSKRKRSKLLDMLLNTNWSKQNQQASNLIKLNKILLVCDANFLDEKSGESPLSLVITSPQINALSSQQSNQQQANLSSKMGATGQPASLFSLQCQSTDLSQSMLQQASVSDLCQSQAPLVQRILLLLIKSGSLIDFRNADGRTPLHMATMKSNFWALKTLLDLGASTDYRDINGLTPLYYSILHKADLKVTQLLLNHNKTRNLSTSASQHQPVIPIGVTDQHGWQELHHACKLGLDAHLEKLLYYGCDINARISGSGNTPLHVAAINDQLDCAKVLLMRGADKTITNNSHQTAHQVAVISNNLDMAEFITEHDETKVVPFRDRPANYVDQASRSQVPTNPTASSLTSNTDHANQSNFSQTSRQSLPSTVQRAVVLPQPSMNPLSIDMAQIGRGSVSTGSSQHQSLLSIGGQSGQLNLQINNVSPCLSQRSCATSNTTSSSGVCCDLEANQSAEDLRQQHQIKMNNSQHSNVTVVSIVNKSDRNGDVASQAGDNNVEQKSENLQDTDEYGEDGDDDLRSSASSGSNWGLYSLMSDERPLYVGTIVEAMSEYQSGDPSHLQLHRGDLIEVLEYSQGPLPKLANKPMIFGVRKSDGLSGLFPSFCVQRSKHRQPRQQPLADITNGRQNIRGQSLPESKSMAALDRRSMLVEKDDFRSKFMEIRTTLSKFNEGFGFVLRGAKIDPNILGTTNPYGSTDSNKVVIDERLMAANNLISLQYLDEIEPNSAAHMAGLKRGDFLIAVNEQDVRLSSHEQVVQMIRQSGSQVQLTIATPIDLTSFKQQQPQPAHTSGRTAIRAKPEPPKRDPTTTLTRNRTQRVDPIQTTGGQQQPSGYNPDQFDQSKPLPSAPSTEPPVSPTGSHINAVNRSLSSNLLCHQSINSLSSATDTQSISSVSTISADHQSHHHQQQDSQQPTPTHSSSSTATLTTVAASKPKAPPKPNGFGLTSSAANQQTYQSAALITTTKKITMPNSNPPSPPKQSSYEIIAAPSMSDTPAPQQQPPPPPPPPPPPLPDFDSTGLTKTGDRLEQRRKSAPINQMNELALDKAQLLRKRESLVTVGPLSSARSNNNSQPPVPAQFGAVAAACAAAANNRLQRQQVAQGKSVVDSDKSSAIDKNLDQPDSKSAPDGCSVAQQGSLKDKEVERAPHLKLEPSIEVGRGHSRGAEANDEMMRPSTTRHQMLSATLGRRSSAQIIQQPKQQSMHSQSQTLRSKPKRSPLPNYDELPPPPPPLSPMPDTEIPMVRRQQGRDHDHEIIPVYHVHHQTQHLVEQQMLSRPEMINMAPPKRQVQEMSLHQQQQAALLHQQKFMKQQLLQQQIALHQQQLQYQQMQMQQRQCLGHDQHHQQYGTLVTKSHQHVHELPHSKQQHPVMTSNHSNHSHHNHHHHHHNHHNHHNHHSHHQHQHHHRNEPATTKAVMQPQYQPQAINGGLYWVLKRD